MRTVAVTFYDVVVWLHVTSVVVAFGPTFAFGIFYTLAARKHPRAMPAMIEGVTLVGRSLITIGGVLILLTGIYLSADRWDFSDFFVGWGILALLILLGLTHGYFIPNDQRALRAAERDIEAAGPTGEVKFGEEFDEYSGRSAKLGPIAGLLIILTIYVMVAKPFL